VSFSRELFSYCIYVSFSLLVISQLKVIFLGFSFSMHFLRVPSNSDCFLLMYCAFGMNLGEENLWTAVQLHSLLQKQCFVLLLQLFVMFCSFTSLISCNQFDHNGWCAFWGIDFVICNVVCHGVINLWNLQVVQYFVCLRHFFDHGCVLWGN
jgi:hypothetical protein